MRVQPEIGCSEGFPVLPDAAEESENDEVGGGGGERGDDATETAH